MVKLVKLKFKSLNSREPSNLARVRLTLGSHLTCFTSSKLMDRSRWPGRLCREAQSTDEMDLVRSTSGRPATAERRVTTAIVTDMWARSTLSLSAVSIPSIHWYTLVLL